MLAPASWDKTEYQDILQPVWSQAVSELQRATRICVIGYSLPESDAYFKYLLTLGLSENHSIYKFIVIDIIQAPIFAQMIGGKNGSVPISKTLRERYEDLLEDLFQERRFTFRGDGLWHWISNGAIMQDLGRGEMITRGEASILTC